MEHSRSASQKGNLSFRQYWLNRTKELCNTINRKIISKVQFGVEKFKKTDKNVTLVPTKFSTEIFENLSRKELANLSATFRDLFHFINNLVNCTMSETNQQYISWTISCRKLKQIRVAYFSCTFMSTCSRQTLGAR